MAEPKDKFLGFSDNQKTLNEKDLQDLDKALKEKFAKDNQASVELGIPLTQQDKNKTEVYRMGLCGDACTLAKSFAAQKSIQLEKHQAQDSSGGNHFFLTDSGNNIIEPTYKQFLYRVFVDPNSGEIRKGAEEAVQHINQMDNIFVGTKEELAKTISQTLTELGAEKSIAEALDNWGFEKSLIEENLPKKDEKKKPAL